MITKIDDNHGGKIGRSNLGGKRKGPPQNLCTSLVWFPRRGLLEHSIRIVEWDNKSNYIYEVTAVHPYSLAEFFGNDESFIEDPDEFRAWYLDEDDGENSLSQTDQAEYWARGEGAELLARLLRRENNKNQINEDIGEYADF